MCDVLLQKIRGEESKEKWWWKRQGRKEVEGVGKESERDGKEASGWKGTAEGQRWSRRWKEEALKLLRLFFL